MLYHYLQIALRRIWKKRSLSLLKILGLGSGIAASILLVAYVEYQWQFDHFQERRDQIFRIQNDQYSEGALIQRSAMTYAATAVALKEISPDVLDYARLGRWIANDVVFQYNGKAVRDKDFFFAEPSFFDIFSFDLLKGDPKTALEAPNSLILSQKNARILFGEEDPMGKEVVLEGRKIFTVTGVSKNTPEQSHLQFGLLASYATVQKWGFDIYGDDHWAYFYVYAYVLLREGTNAGALAEKLTRWVDKRKEDALIKDDFYLQALKDIHLYSDLQFELGPTGNGSNLWILFGASLLTLLLAWINQVNIFTAGAIDQLKSLGVRRIVGASRRQIIGQLTVEALAISIFGLILGVLLAEIGKPLIANFFHIHLSNIHWQNLEWGGPLLWLSAAIFGGVLASVLAPAYILSSLRPIQILNKSFKLPGFGVNIQKGLTIFQFAIIIALLSASFVIYQQTRFMRQKDPGFALSDRLVLRGPLGNKHYENLSPYYAQFKNRVETYPEVQKIAMSREIPGNQIELVQDVRVNGRLSPLSFNRLTVEADFFDVYQIPFLSGKIPDAIDQLERKVVINQSAQELLGFKNAESAIRQKINFFDWDLEIVGVVKNHHHRSLHHPEPPILYDISKDPFEDGYFTLVLNNPINKNLVDKIKTAYASSFPNTVFDYFELANRYHAQYQSDIDFRRLNLCFTMLSFFIACLGLFGLSLMVFEKRVKEIGIRKVLGASVLNIVGLLVSGLLRLVIVGGVVAAPLSWYLLNRWLSNFTFRIDIHWSVFVLAGLTALSAAFLTMSVQSVKAALTDPAEVLRRE